jgi:hypothetical protein
MVKCPFCGFANEDGALFCEQCKSDISNVAPAPSVPPSGHPTPMPESVPPAAEAPVMAAIVEDAPIVAEVVPVAPAEEEPIAAAVVEDESVAPIKEEPAIAAAVVGEKVVPATAPPDAPAASETAPQALPDVSPFAAAVGAVVGTPTPPAPTTPAAKPAGGTPIPAGAQVKLVVQRGLKIGEEYNVFAGENYVGRADEKPVDIDLTFQEPEDRVWCSRQHALLVFDDGAGTLTIEDLNSSNGTFVNRERVYPGQPRQLFVGNTIQIGTVHMRVKA